MKKTMLHSALWASTLPNGSVLISSDKPGVWDSPIGTTNLFREESRFPNSDSKSAKERMNDAAIDELINQITLSNDDIEKLTDESTGLSMLQAKIEVEGGASLNDYQSLTMNILYVNAEGRYTINRFWRFGKPGETPLSLSRDLQSATSMEAMHFMFNNF